MLSGIPNCSAAQTREPSEQRQAISPAPTSQRVGTETSRSCSRQVRKSPERLGSVEERNSHILHRQVKHFSIFSDKCGDFPPLGDLSRASPDAFHSKKVLAVEASVAVDGHEKAWRNSKEQAEQTFNDLRFAAEEDAQRSGDGAATETRRRLQHIVIEV